MINESKNKAIEGASTVRAVSVIKNEYHFAGSGIWKPMSVVASTIEEATTEWEKKRVPAEKSPAKAEAQAPEKVEEPKEPVNE